MSHLCCIYSVENSFLSALGPELVFLAWGSYELGRAHWGGGGALLGNKWKYIFFSSFICRALESQNVLDGLETSVPTTVFFRRLWSFNRLFCLFLSDFGLLFNKKSAKLRG